MEVYVVMCRTGEYDCEYTRPVFVINTKQEAEEEVFRLNNSVRKYCQRINRLEEKLENRAAYLADKASPDLAGKEFLDLDDYEEWDSVFNLAYDKLYDKLRKKYPNLTGDYDESTSWYYYERCEFKGES